MPPGLRLLITKMKKYAEQLRRMLQPLRSRRDYGYKEEEEEPRIQLESIRHVHSESDAAPILYEVRIRRGLFPETYTVETVPNLVEIFNRAQNNQRLSDNFYEKYLKGLTPMEARPRRNFKEIIELLKRKNT